MDAPVGVYQLRFDHLRENLAVAEIAISESMLELDAIGANAELAG